jgi:prolyl-tRNA editing enzyme YbaK/EbsC (Cys-tRNA(Pro) deacylase)
MSDTSTLKKISEENELEFAPLTLTEITRTAKEAAKAVGCSFAEIAKSIIFKGLFSGKPYLVIASGINRINEKNIREEVANLLKREMQILLRITLALLLVVFLHSGTRKRLKLILAKTY